MFEIYESYYNMGLFTDADIKLFVEVGDLTQADADKILKPAVAAPAQPAVAAPAQPTNQPQA